MMENAPGSRKNYVIMRETPQSLLEKKILVLDGAMGTMIQRHKLEEKIFDRNDSLHTLIR